MGNKADKRALKAEEIAKEARKKAKKAAKKAKAEAAKLARKAEEQAKKAKDRAKKDAKKAAKKAGKSAEKNAEKKSEKSVKPDPSEPTPTKVADPAPITTLGAPTDDWSVVALRARAREVGLTGYSKMTKAELLAALRR